jgi:hypothetical protein
VTNNSKGAAAGGGAIYGLGVLGAWVYFWIQANTFWEHLFAIVQGLLWPAWMVYDIFVALNRSTAVATVLAPHLLR